MHIRPWHDYAHALTLLARGRSLLSISEELGIPRTTLSRWGTLAGMTFEHGPRGGATPAHTTRMTSINAGRAYRRLTLTDRAFIQAARALPDPLSIRGIAAELGVAPSTISREVRAHEFSYGTKRRYIAELAHYQASRSTPRPRPGKLDDPVLRREVVSRLNLRFSPQQVAGQLRRTFPGQAEMQVSHETIYQALYVQGKGALRHELTVEKALRSGQTSRKPQSRLPRRSSRPWLEGARLADRPGDVTARVVPGHWEGDLVVGPENSGIVTLVERQTRFTLIGRLPGVRDSRTVIEVMRGMITGLPDELLRTITWDQGAEMAEHARFTIATGCRVFFCDPHSPWQRGTNENTNGLIRDFYPKGTNFNEVSDAGLARTQWLLNIRPRATLGYATPGERLEALITGVALTP